MLYTPKKRYNSTLNADINVTPLVDVMLVLLIIFMVTAPMLVTGVDVNLPKTSAKAIPGSDEPLVVSINTRGEVFIANTEIDVDKLPLKLSAILQEKPDSRVFVRADKELSYSKVMDLFSTIQKSGFKHIALVTEKD